MPSADTRMQEFASFVHDAETLLFVTGAGMSTRSGVPDFRSEEGLYSRGVDQRVFELREFYSNPEYFYQFAADFFPSVMNAEPHAGHRAITALADDFGKNVAVSTQNIDTLHQDAGNPNVYPVHGVVSTSTCVECGHKVPSAEIWPAVKSGEVPRHEVDDGVYKPDIVFFGERLPEEDLNASVKAARESDIVVVAGTSLAVYPAAGIPRARSPESSLVIINKDETPLDAQADLVFRESIAEVMGELIDTLNGQ